MKVRYVGPYTEGVEIPELGMTAAHNETIEVPDDVGQRMVESADWETVGRTKKGGDE